MAPIPGRHHGQRDAGRYGFAPCPPPPPNAASAAPSSSAARCPGLFSAAFLRQIGWQADVYERSRRRTGRARRRHHRPSGTARRARRRAAPAPTISASRCPSASPSTATAASPTSGRLRQILTSWDRLQRLLRATIDPAHYHLGWNFERVEQDERGVRVQFSGGRVEHADILIGGDGIRSSVRGQMAPEVQPVYAGYYIWRGAPNEADLAPKTLDSIYPLFHLLSAQAAAGDHLSDRRLQRRPHARQAPLQFHLVPRRRRRQAARDERRRERRAARILGAAAADPQGPDRARCTKTRAKSCRRLCSTP